MELIITVIITNIAANSFKAELGISYVVGLKYADLFHHIGFPTLTRLFLKNMKLRL